MTWDVWYTRQDGDVHLEQLPSGSWRVTVSNFGQRRRGTATTKGEARRLGGQMLVEMGGTPTDDPTVADLLDAWRAEVKHAVSTATRRDIAIAAIPEVFMARPLSNVTPPVVAALWREMGANGVGPHTIDKARNALSAAWALAVEWGMAQRNPIRAVKWSPPESKRPAPPPSEQVREILAAFEQRPALAAWLRTMAICGARPGELCAIRWDGLDVASRTITIAESVDRTGSLTTGKNGPGGHRDVRLDPATFRALRSVDRVVGVPWVFQRNGSPWRPQYVSQEFDRVRDRLGFTWRLYGLRHFAASSAIARGVPIPEVARMLGDSAETVLRVYAHPTSGTSAAEAVAAGLDG